MLTVIRSRDDEVIASADIVVDVGGVYDSSSQRFDHHQIGAPVRENGIPYAAFGLVWKEYGSIVAGSEAAARDIEERLVHAVDAGDNGVSLYTLSSHAVTPAEVYGVVGSFLPPWGSEKSMDEAFFEAVIFARDYLSRMIVHASAIQAMNSLALAAYHAASNRQVLSFDVPMSRTPFIALPEVLLIICPAEHKSTCNWQVAAVPVAPHSFETKISFPEAWRGLRDADLVSASGIGDAVFCHKNGFLFVASSKEGVQQAVSKTLE